MDFSLNSPIAFSPGLFFSDTIGKCEFFELNFSKKASNYYEEFQENHENSEFFDEIIKETVMNIMDEICLNLEGDFKENYQRIVPNIEEFSGIRKRIFKGIYNEIGVESGKFGWFFYLSRFLLIFYKKVHYLQKFC